MITLADPLRLGHERSYYPGEANVKLADVVIINKVDTASPEAVDTLEKSLRELNPQAKIIKAESPITVTEPEKAKGKKVLVIEDGPTLTHGEMSFGAGYLAAKQSEVGEIVDPRPYSVGSIKEVYKKFPHIGNILPAMGYSPTQMDELKKTIGDTPCDLVIIGTPIDLRRYIDISKPSVRVSYDLKELGDVSLKEILSPIVVGSLK
jgi:predicted GTPase